MTRIEEEIRTLLGVDGHAVYADEYDAAARYVWGSRHLVTDAMCRVYSDTLANVLAIAKASVDAQSAAERLPESEQPEIADHRIRMY